MSLEFLQNDFDKVSYLVNLLTSRATGLAADDREFQVLRHELLNEASIAPMFPPWLRQHRSLDSFWGFIKQRYGTYAERRTFISQEFTPVLDFLEFGKSTPTPSSGQMPQVHAPAFSNMARNKRKVFIVHGHDNAAKQEVCRFVEKLGLVAIVLHEQASSGMTIIEKIEHYANDADFALVLYTPCDLGNAAADQTLPLRNRARQNVIFEHGYLIAKLGRENVCSLVKGDIETPNDISGVVYVALDIGGAWKTVVAKELKTAGYTIQSWF